MSEQFRLEDFTERWNNAFPQFPIAIKDINNPSAHFFISTLLDLFGPLGINKDNVLAPPPESERDEHTEYYWDLIPAINVTRVVTHIISELTENKISLGNILAPNQNTTHTVLFLLHNLAVFNTNKTNEIKLMENKIFEQGKQVENMQAERDRLLALLNEQAAEKATRSMRIEKLQEDLHNLTEELQMEKKAHDDEKRSLEEILSENKEFEVLLEQKKAQKEAIITELNGLRAQKVTDADDIRAQYEQAVRSVEELTEKRKSLKEMLLLKESSLKNLLTVKAKLDEAIGYEHEILKLSETLKELSGNEGRDVDLESAMEAVEAEIREAEAQAAEQQRELKELSTARAASLAEQQAWQAQTQSTISETKATEKKVKEKLEQVQLVKQQTDAYEQERLSIMEEVAQIKENFSTELKTFQEALLEKSDEAVKKVKSKMNNLHSAQM